MTLSAIKPTSFPWFEYEGFTFCLGLVEGDAGWTSGCTSAATDPAIGKMTVSGTMKEQASIAYEKMLVILATVGLGIEDVTRVTENVTLSGLDQYEDAAQVRRDVLGGHEPSVRTVVVERLVRRAAYLEVEMHAVKDGGTVLVTSAEIEVGTANGSPVREGFDGLVYLPTILPIEADGTPVAGGVAAQYRWCLDRAEELLTTAGLGLADVAVVYDYSTPQTREAHAETIGVRRERFAGDAALPAAGSILMSRLHRPGVLVAVDVIASRHPRTKVDPGWGHFKELACSPAVRVGRTLFVSGINAVDPTTGELAAGDVGVQSRAAYSTLTALLAHEGLTPADLLETTEYCAERAVPDYRAVAGVRAELLTPPWPASTGAICAGLVHPEALLEVFPAALYPEGA
ncbi:MAG TPA: RidA family protein [Marmoricola sp.]|jgi:enamine deaminase RidA (YjgF/YER057c/UK114 family)|nr:RidA family protein [Marmoricola sp.]